ncbi:hypothetical protein RVR_2809 [Actinacidiphila reveromycinica]|uniref:Uncharacterized protein n=1 Tax=Actinacidiphila reveromycinica TaxID=659352 RepID=A0A7U3VN19_9ACTN|nr:hypothetical protein [Streptomyces sp. SN-593]BBA97182.1 hypothetical protein RVR_2809 [Streptomyces sp. SN-593]
MPDAQPDEPTPDSTPEPPLVDSRDMLIARVRSEMLLRGEEDRER